MRSWANSYSDRSKPLRLDQKIQDLQRPKPALQLRGRHAGHGRQQGRRNSWADDGRKLEKRLVLLRQAIDAGRNDPLHGGRNFQRVPGSLGGNPAGVGLEDAAIDELPCDLLDEERDLTGVAKDVSLERGRDPAPCRAGRRAAHCAEEISSDRSQILRTSSRASHPGVSSVRHVSSTSSGWLAASDIRASMAVSLWPSIQCRSSSSSTVGRVETTLADAYRARHR